MNSNFPENSPYLERIAVDYVMFVTDPNSVEGGEFQYFFGTRDEMAQLRSEGNTRT